MSLKSALEKLEPAFEPGGKYQKWHALYEAIATLLYTPGQVTQSHTHVRDSIDLKRIMIMVWLAVFPALFWGMYNIGNQAIIALHSLYSPEQLQAIIADNWRYSLTETLGGSLAATAGWGSKMLLGAMHFLPIYAVVFIVGGFWEVLFAWYESTKLTRASSSLPSFLP
ncbi:Na(+)-translocating NADH-quinone reductase subunit B [Photobacterium aphoticum]|uniref:Na(+)-translocating NADH-quinone reductase subunit B n=1 Tax=Photobacterium aphoticum TaxID=754436 RepID=A0A090QU44_9GAMM|nr:Na(+)-translocating NADH-quinone reductase subunit B [Photobacterium aphoticum]